MVHLFIFDSAAGQVFFLAGNQNEIANINNRPQTLSQNEYGVFFVNGVGQQYDTAAYAEIPERQGDDAFPAFFRNDPLDYKPHAKQRLAHKTNDQPISCGHLLLLNDIKM